jgi:hypothetical protein
MVKVFLFASLWFMSLTTYGQTIYMPTTVYVPQTQTVYMPTVYVPITPVYYVYPYPVYAYPMPVYPSHKVWINTKIYYECQPIRNFLRAITP